MKAVLIVLALAMASAVVLAADADVESQSQEEMVMEVDEQGKPKLVPAKVYGADVRMYPLKVVMVPKGDPRARRPAGSYDADSQWEDDGEDHGEDPRYNRWGFAKGQRRNRWFDAVKSAWQRTRWGRPSDSSSPSSRPVLQAGGGQCPARGGACGERSACTGTVVTGLCAGPSSIVCCVPKATTPTTPTTPSTPTANCPVYGSASTFKKTGNQNKVYDVVWITREHLSTPSMYMNPADDQMDNTLTKTTACAFARMAEAAAKDGVRLTVNSGFRTLARQQYFYRCMNCKCCNNGNLAAKPGNSNHGFGLATDLNTNCGGQGTAAHPPALCKSSAQYMWLLNRAQRDFGFIRTVQKEPWHWEYRPGQANPSWAKF